VESINQTGEVPMRFCKDKRVSFFGFGVAVGVGMGTALGVANGSMWTWIAVGAGIGAAYAGMLDGLRFRAEHKSDLEHE
jgi:hypothetical protein